MDLMPYLPPGMCARTIDIETLDLTFLQTEARQCIQYSIGQFVIERNLPIVYKVIVAVLKKNGLPEKRLRSNLKKSPMERFQSPKIYILRHTL